MFYKIAHIENGEKVVINVELNGYVFFPNINQVIILSFCAVALKK